MLTPGTRIGPRYVIDRLLGQGGMSNLYIATDLTQGNAVRVIKEMTARYADPKEQQQAEDLFMREAQLLATLNHPHIPKVYDKFRFQGKYYLSMEYCPGDDLGKMIQDRGTIEEKMAASWGAQMATVLYYLHRQNPPIVFRDVKPSNIMIVNDQVKLIDFGIARLFTSAKKGDTMRIGSPGYAPPEQYSGQTDPRSDIYALGVTLHHAVTGYDPTISQTPFLIPPARSLNPKVSPEMEALIARATQLDPDKRYDNCLEMKRDLQVVMRNHGLMVGASVPFSAANQAQAQAQVQAQAQAPGATPTATPAPTVPPATPSPPTPSPAPTPTPPTTPPTVAPASAAAPKKRSLAPVALAALALGLGVGALKAPPAWRDAAGEQLNRLMAQMQWLLPTSAPPLPDAEKVLLEGGSVTAAAEALGQEVRQGKGTPEQVLTYQNALVYASGRPLQRLAVVAPAHLKVASTLAAWQRTHWNEANRDGKMLVISLENVDQDWAGAVRRSASTKLFREGQLADAVLIYPPLQRPSGWASWFDKSPPLYWVGPRQDSDPKLAQELPTLQPNYADWLEGMQLGDSVWLAKDPPPPSSIKGQEFPGPEGVARLLKQNPRPLLIVDPEQIKGLDGWPKVGGTRLLMIAGPGALPAEPPTVPSGYYLYAASQSTPFSADPTVARFFQMGSDRSAPLYDSLGWVGGKLLGESRQTGLTWHSDRNGDIEEARWNLLESRNGHWCWLREGGGK
jgi:serine/threonine protein kinase